MVKVERAVTAPEFLDVGNNLIVVSFGAARYVHTQRLKLDSCCDAQRLKSPALRGFIAQRRWIEGLRKSIFI